MRDHLTGPSFVRVSQSNAADAVEAVEEAVASLVLPEICFVIAFLPQAMDRDAVSRHLDRALGGIPAFGCTSAGQITANGYEADALLLLAFPKAHFRCASSLIAPLQPISTSAIAAGVSKLQAQFQHTAGWNRFALVFADGLSKQEDLLTSTLETALSDTPVFGGSAGDGLAFRETVVLHHGRFHGNAALLLLVETNLQFEGFSFDHFLPSDTQLVITAADPEARKVFEINGAPAADEYARLVGCTTHELSPEVFAEHPILVRHKNTYFVRAISDASDDGSLSFMAAIDEGVILTLGRGIEIIETLKSGLTRRDAMGQPPDFVLGFDCVLRKLEIEQKHLQDTVSAAFRDARVLGFNTYGEQHCGVHMNQTFVGLAFFAPKSGSFD